MTRIVLTLLAALAFAGLLAAFSPVATILSGAAAGGQLQNSDQAAISASYIASGLGLVQVAAGIVLLVVLYLIWRQPLAAALKSLGLFAAVLATVFIAAPRPASAFFETTDKTEAYTILPNESAFWIPDQGANKDSQGKLDSEDYLNANKIALKRFIVPHQRLQGSGGICVFCVPGYDAYVPTGRLIIVDRSPYSREWVDASDRGSAAKKEGFPCQSKEGLNITAGVSIGVSVTKGNAAKFLHRFGVKPVAGDRSDPHVIFTTVYFGRSLTEVMDDVGRKKVQTLVCNEIGKRSFDEANAQMVPIMDAISKASADYFAGVGITLDFIGWGDTFNFDKEVQDAVNRRYIASQDQQIATSLAPYADTIEKLAAAQALRSFGAKSDGHLPTTIVGLPPDVGGLLRTLLSSTAPATPAKP